MSASSYKLLLNDFYTRTRELIDRCESEERITVSILKDYQKQMPSNKLHRLSKSFQDVIEWIEMEENK